MSELLSQEENKIRVVKGLLRGLSTGLEEKGLGLKFRDILKDVTKDDIARSAGELLDEGSESEVIDSSVQKLEQIIEDSHVEPELPPAGHPLHILMMEHKLLIELGAELRDVAGNMKNSSNGKDNLERLEKVVSNLEDSASHYLREENVLFPYLEKHGIVGPLKVMWMEHDNIREIKKELVNLIKSADKDKPENFAADLVKIANELSENYSVHFNKENTILYQAAFRVIDELEWIEIRKQFDEMGYPEFLPKDSLIELEGQNDITTTHDPEGGIVFDTGSFSAIQLESLLDTVPFDITFIDDEDRVRYFNQPGDPIFTRMKATLGTRVQNCHPSKSVHMVDEILTGFRSGEKKTAEFWIKMGPKYVYIRYFPVRDKEGNYLGCMEVSQDIAPIQTIEGEKRLL